VTIFLLLIVMIGAAPLAVGLGLAIRRRPVFAFAPSAGAVLLCALAFDLVFFWQELWLVIPKALTPGLHPVLYHNNHEWTGEAAIAELLQGSGALATLTIGLLFAAILSARPALGPTARSFCFWMGFQGLSQSLTQCAVGTVLPGNDVGRALAYLGLGSVGHIVLLLLTVAALAMSGFLLARLFPAAAPGDRVDPQMGLSVVLLSAMLSVALIVPFRVPRSPIETTLIPIAVNLVGAGWTVLGFARSPGQARPARPRTLAPALLLVALLLLFQLVLRPGIRF
jgi:hypothetical protein